MPPCFAFGGMRPLGIFWGKPWHSGVALWRESYYRKATAPSERRAVLNPCPAGPDHHFRRKSLHRLSRYILAAVLVLATAPAAFAGQVVDRVVADVNGEIVTLFELNQRVKPYLERYKGRQLTEADKASIMKLKHKLLDGMVNNILIRQEVQRLGINISDVEVDNEMESYKTRANLNGTSFEKQLTLEGMTVDEFKQKLRDDILRHKLLGYMVKRKVAVTDEDIQRYYDEHSYQFRGDRTVDLSLIVCAEGVDVDNLRDRIAKEEISFADAADLYSQGPGMGQGGRIGEMSWGDLAPEWQSALDGLGKDEMSQPFFIQGHEALLYVNQVESEGTQPIEEVHDAIYDAIYQQRLEERFAEYMSKLKENALIDIKL